MARRRIHGNDRNKFIERVTVADMAALPAQNATLSVILTDKGTIVDDTIITNAGDHV